MKTTSFATVKVIRNKRGDPVLEVFGPGQGTVKVCMTGDEFMLLLVELHNGLAESRKKELREKIAYTLEKEQRR